MTHLTTDSAHSPAATAVSHHKPARNLPLDFLRGYFLVIITINHLALANNEWVRPFTGLNHLWVSAAAGFVIVSGIVVGHIFPQRIAQQGLRPVLGQTLRRSAQLYLITVIGQIILATGDFILHFWRGRITHIPLNYFKVVEGAILQNGYTYWYIDLLPLYAVLLPLGVLAVWAVQQGYGRWVLITALVVWYMRLTDPSAMRFFANGFQPASWQILFMAGIFAGLNQARLQQWWQKWGNGWLTAVLLLAAGAALFLSYQITFNGWLPNVSWLQSSSAFFDKSRVGVGRLLVALLVMAALYTAVSRWWQPLQKVAGWLLLPLGQNSLTAYVLQGILSYSVTRLPGWPFANLSPLLTTAVMITAVLLVWLLTRLLAAAYPHLPTRWRKRARQQPPAPNSQLPTTHSHLSKTTHP